MIFFAHEARATPRGVPAPIFTQNEGNISMLSGNETAVKERDVCVDLV